MEECPPGGDCASAEGDPSKSDNPRASWGPNPAGKQAQGKSVSREDDVSQAASQSPEPKRKVSSALSGPMTEWHQAALVALQRNLQLNVKMFQLSGMLGRPAGGFMDRAEVLRVNAKTGDMEQMGEVINILLGKEDRAFCAFCDMLQRSNYEVWARELKSEAERLKTVGAPNEGGQTGSRICVSKTTARGMAMEVSPSPDVPALSLESCKMDIVSCDSNVFKSQKHPSDAIRSLYFNAYNHLIRILSTHCSAIKSLALTAVRTKEVSATEVEVKEACDLRALFECLEVDKKWNDLSFIALAILSLPVEASKEKSAAQLVFNQYKSYLTQYVKAVSIKEGKSVRDFLQRKRGREEKMVVTKTTVDKEIDECTCGDLLALWKLFLIETLKIPEDHIKYDGATPNNSTTFVFIITQTYAEGIKKKLSKPDAVWVMKELGILRVYVTGMVSMDLREVLPNVLIASIREGLESGVDFVSLTKTFSQQFQAVVALDVTAQSLKSLAEQEKAVTYKRLMQHLRCGAEIEALFSAQKATSFLPIQMMDLPLRQESTKSEEDARERVVATTFDTVLDEELMDNPLSQESSTSEENTMMAEQLSQESTNSEKDASELVTAITRNTAPGPIRGLLQPFGLHYYFQRVSCRGKVLIEEYCNCRKLLGNNVKEAHEHWREVVAQVKIDPVLKACALSFSVISTPETTEYLQKHWNDLQRRMDRGSPDYKMSRFMAQYALSWAQRSQDLDKALSAMRTCYKEMKKDNPDNFFLAPYYTVTIGRWIFEANEHNLSDDVIKEVLQYAAETLRLIATLEEDWARIDAFGAKISALNLMLLVANYLYRQLLHFTDGFKDLYPRIQRLYKEISEELNQNCSRVVLYDQAWFHSVSATYYQLASNTTTTQEEKDRMYALSQRSIAQAARLYDINGRWWRSREEAKRADNPDLIRKYAKHGRSAPPV